jgi:hypothetical protein
MRTNLSLSAAAALELYWLRWADTYDGIPAFYQTLGWDLQEHEILIHRLNNYTYNSLTEYQYSLPNNQVVFFLLNYAS